MKLVISILSSVSKIIWSQAPSLIALLLIYIAKQPSNSSDILTFKTSFVRLIGLNNREKWS